MTRSRKALLLAALLALLSGVIFSGCGKPGSKVTLRCAFWGDTSEIEIIKKSVGDFEKANPGIDVKLERLPAGDPYTEKILTQIAGGNPVDVMFVNAEQFYIYAKKSILLPLNDFAARDRMRLDKFYPKIIEKFTVDKNLYVLPRDIAPVCVVFYNKEIFNANGIKYPDAGWDWDNMRDLAVKMTKKNKDGSTTFGYADEWGIWEPFVMSNGGKLVDDVKKPTRCMLDSPVAMEALQYRHDLIYKYKVMPSPSQLSAMGGVGAADLFVNGKTAMFLSGIWKTPYFRQTVKFDWDAQVFPKGPKGGRGWLISGGGYSILRTTKHPEEAWKLLTFLAGEDGQKALAETGLAQPAIREIAGSASFLDGKPPLSKKFLLDAVNYGSFAPDTDKWQESLNSYIFPALDKIWANDKKPQDVMPAAVGKVNKLIDQVEN